MGSEIFPVFLKLAGRPVLVVGAGPVAVGKIESLLAAGASVTVVAPEVRPEIERLPVQLERRGFADSDLDGAWFAVAAAPPAVNRAVAEAAEKRRIFVNAVDDPPNASVYFGGVVRKSGVTLAVSTNGRAPAIAGLLRQGLERLLPDDLDEWMRIADVCRQDWLTARVPMEARRPSLLAAINAAYAAQHAATAGGSR
jgi:uroporphyrin-III C-methyltransferase/precorrin-2 dehydrogenase/sirohydrochlorin ferrochelatase